ncbi:aldehyde dehydrogenase family protein [Microbacterium sp.]|uniref:aldehyde dehydrogenase family protein n=1 Tax=Microbacterium sp. TaxID=51671 RepID=UPI0037C721E0
MSTTTPRPRVEDYRLAPLVDGRPYTDSEQGFTVFDPSTGVGVIEIPDVGAHGVAAAASAARRAYPAWRDLEPRQRAGALLALADVVERRAQDLSLLESLDVGKPLSMVPAEIASAVDKIRFYAGAARILPGIAANEYRKPLTSFIRREPVGVVGAITPWNYPFAMAIWKIAPALAAGNTVVLKPSPETPLSTLMLGALAAEVLPAGVLNVVTGGLETGRAMTRSPEVDMIALTGGTATGRAVMRDAADSLKRLQLELGGNAAVLVFDDADLDLFREGYFMAAFRNTGQDCHAASRIYAAPGIKDDVVRVVREVAAESVVGDPFAADTNVGPLVSAAQLDRVGGLVDEALSNQHIERATPVDCPEGGFYYPLTVLDGVRHDDTISQEEIFGPVVTVSTFADEDEAIQLANGVSQGLAASVWTASTDRAFRVSHQIDAGTIWVNAHGATVAEMPFGGVKESGFGTDLSTVAMDQFTVPKHIAFRSGRRS